MTILTKQDKKNSGKIADSIKVPIEDDGISSQEVQPEILWNAQAEWMNYLRRRRRLLTTLCALFMILWLMLAAIVGGILLFKYMNRKPLIYGWCGAKFNNDGDGRQQLQQRVEVDPEMSYERVEVPKFGMNRPAAFIHDFNMNLTAIVDLRGKQCYIKPLDPNVKLPRSILDLFQKAEDGYYVEDSTVINENWVARHPALSKQELNDLHSPMIQSNCAQKQSFLLKRFYRDESGVHGLERSKRCATEESLFYEFLPSQHAVKSVKIAFNSC